MKSFALHLVVVFIVGAQYHQIGTFCSSASQPAHDRFNFSTGSTRSTNSSSSSASNGIQHQQTTKTPRMIQRLIGGHLQHGKERKQHEVNINTTQLSRVYFRRKPNPVRNTFHSRRNTTLLTKPQPEVDEVEDLNDDAALLEDPKESDNWDNGILRLSAGAGKEEQIKSKKKDDSKKTLSDQVREGKYGLIEKEIFGSEPKRPGIISYLSNKEVPGDNVHNLGGLNEDDIWLAEDHLLVLKGGGLNDKDLNEPWEPIDDYQAPSRQIKIPANPKVPPPFPVQFEDNGPIQFIGDHKFPFFNTFSNQTVQSFPSDGYLPPEANGYNEKDLFTRTGSPQNATNSKGGYFYPAPYPPWLFNNETFMNPFLNFAAPPGSLDGFNSSDYIDEDDPSLYYPPPYSFVYKSNYSNPVGPGPLVPGIVLPPPPNAFARLEEPTSKPPSKEIPFRQILTKISEYNPKTIVITTTTTTSTTTTTPTPTTTTPISTTPKEIIFAITKPPKTERIRVYTTPKQFAKPTPAQDIIQFVPKAPSPSDGLSKSNPIYYEYFDARRAPVEPVYYRDYTTTTPAPTRKHKKLPITTRPPVRQQQQQQQHYNNNYLPTRAPFNYDDFIYITPKPEIRPNGITNNFVPVLVKTAYKPIQNFDREVDAIRQTLQYYKSQQLQQNYIPRAPKAKAVYEYSFDATKGNREFTPPPQYDDEPFKPMVKYSRPMDDANGFKAIAYSKSDEISSQKPNYYPTPTPAPQQKVRVGAKAYLQPIVYNTTPRPQQQNYIQRPSQDIQYTTPRTTNSVNQPWVSIEKQIVQEVVPPTTRTSSSRHRTAASYSRNVEPPPRNQFSGYFYNSPAPSSRQNDRYYQLSNEEPFTQQVSSIKGQLSQFRYQPPISLENDTYVNYAPNRPPINPDAEYIHPSRREQYQHLPLSQQQRLPPSRQQYQPISLNRDILVNYRLPLPPINPDSEYVQPQVVNRNVPQYRPDSVQYRIPNDQSGTYYLQPRDVRFRKN